MPETRKVVLPIPPKCSCYPGQGWPRPRCDRQATHWLFDHEGNKNPGGYVCREHGEAIVKEYTEKLGEVWTLAEIVTSEADTPHFYPKCPWYW